MDSRSDQLRELRDAAFQGRRFKVRARLLTKQDHKCWVCRKPLTALAFDDDPHRPAVVQIDRAKPKETDNSVVLCGKCSGTQGNYPSLTEFKEAFEADPDIVNKKRKDNPFYPETVPLINKLLSEQCTVPYEPLPDNSSYRFAPPDKAEQIVPYIILKEETRLREFQKKERAKNTRRGNPEEVINLTAFNRMRYSERQNHRCCYCGQRMVVDFVRHHPLCATWEHVIPVRDGGADTDSNLVVACSMCNSWREELGMTAMEYFEWAQTHAKEINKRIRERVDRFFRRKWRDRWRQQYLDLMGVSA